MAALGTKSNEPEPAPADLTKCLVAKRLLWPLKHTASTKGNHTCGCELASRKDRVG
jgi:hypothetical protein